MVCSSNLGLISIVSHGLEPSMPDPHFVLLPPGRPWSTHSAGTPPTNCLGASVRLYRHLHLNPDCCGATIHPLLAQIFATFLFGCEVPFLITKLPHLHQSTPTLKRPEWRQPPHPLIHPLALSALDQFLPLPPPSEFRCFWTSCYSTPLNGTFNCHPH